MEKLTDEDLWVMYMLERAQSDRTSLKQDANVADNFVREFNDRFRSGKDNERTK